MKAPESTEKANLDADSAELNGLGCGNESTNQGIKPAHTQGPDTSEVADRSQSSWTPFEAQACALTAKTHGPITWAKTIQVIYFEKPQVRSVQKLFHHFATPP